MRSSPPSANTFPARHFPGCASSASRSISTPWSRTSTRPESMRRPDARRRSVSTRAPRSGPPACQPPRSAGCSPSRPGPRSTAPAGSRCGPDLTLPGHPEVFIVGDMINLDQLPGVAEVAMQGGRFAAKTIVRRLRIGYHRRPVRSSTSTSATWPPSPASGRWRSSVRFRVAGFVGWLLWLFVHLAFLTGFKNRVATVFNWFIAFVGHGRPQRAITQQQVPAARSAARVGLPDGRVD